MEEKILEKLNQVIENASSKYYHYPVAAMIECQDGTLLEGVNVETSSPQAGICAERNALFQAITKGYHQEDIKRVYLLNKTENIITPCFICRQALYDYCSPHLEIISFNNRKEKKVYSLKELCPNSFSEEDLK
ncbi:MAG: cytidine deaminase [bacterium]|nr:cytidine deaminase [bacterium]